MWQPWIASVSPERLALPTAVGMHGCGAIEIGSCPMKALGYVISLIGGIGVGFGVFEIMGLLALSWGRGTRITPSTFTFAVIITVVGIVVGGAGEVIRRRAKRSEAATRALQEAEQPVKSA